jgi:hypothetical protein
MLSPIFFVQQKIKSHKRITQQSVLNGERDSELILLKIPFNQASELLWEHSKEFEFRGNMYDIKTSFTAGDTAYYYCYLDHKEKDLNATKTRLASRIFLGDTHPGKLRKNKVHIPKLTTEEQLPLEFFFLRSKSQTNLKPYCFSLKEFILLNISPPPNFY